MAYPIITDWFRAQVILHGPSGLPTDQFVNNLYFRNDTLGGYQPVADAMEAVLNAFYGDPHSPSAQSISAFIPASIDRVTYKFYDLGLAAPRFPIVPEVEANWSGAAAGGIYPREVAACLSFKGGPGKRERGRIYLGPLAQTTGISGGESGDLRVGGLFITAAGSAAVNMLNTSQNVTWGVVSPTGASAIAVNEVWMDNAFDTQRSRGADPTSRRRFNSGGEILP